MNQHFFGGNWTLHKLSILREYLQFYLTALRRQPFKLLYVDAFAGTGRCTVKKRGTAEEVEGSAQIALDMTPTFDEFIFIEKKPKHVRELARLLETHPMGERAQIVQGLAENELGAILQRQNWRNTRGVLFLDPYGLQCDWTMIEQIAATKALDVFFLVSLSGLYRQATNDLKDADQHKIEALGRFLGTGDWMHELYSVQGDMFGNDERKRHADPIAVAKFVEQRLATVFARVTAPVILYQEDAHGKRGAPLFALYFAVSNPHPKAVALASRVAKDIMTKLR